MADPSESDKQLAALSASRRGQVRYTTSKLCNLYHVYALHARLQEAKVGSRTISVNAFNPGMMPGSGLARSYGRLAKLGWHYLLPLMRYFRSSVRSTVESGRALARLVTDETLSGVSGKYVDGYEEIPSSPESYRQDRAEELWHWSTRMTGTDES
jgi:NAD(P)-dependent dehydrogenase (short-subunit alcohol dehydrogenase family)